VACLDGSVVDEEHFDLHVAKIRGKYPLLSQVWKEGVPPGRVLQNQMQVQAASIKPVGGFHQALA
jgi:hypothetical protein